MSENVLQAPLPGQCPHAIQRVVPIIENVRLAESTYRLRLDCPEIARHIVPGQFVMIREPGTNNPLLGRPFALYDTYLDEHGALAGIDVVYLVLGKMTRLMSGWQLGGKAELWGPLGNGFPAVAENERLIMVAGGIGVTPFLAVGRAARGLRRYGDDAQVGRWGGGEVGRFKEESPLSPPLHPPIAPPLLLYGVRSADYLAGLDDFAAVGVEVRVTTDDGSRGHHGFVTELLSQELAKTRRADAPTLAKNDSSLPTSPPPAPPIIFCCGPEPMMHAVAQIAAKHGAACHLSLETPMACGFGACFSCVTKVREGDGWDYRRVCVEGPVFPAERLAW